MTVKCTFCGKELDENEVKFKITFGKQICYFGTKDCLSKSELGKNISRRSLIHLTLNKTFFELFVIITGLGGMYFTLFEIGKKCSINGHVQRYNCNRDYDNWS